MDPEPILAVVGLLRIHQRVETVNILWRVKTRTVRYRVKTLSSIGQLMWLNSLELDDKITFGRYRFLNYIECCFMEIEPGAMRL